MYLAEKTLHLEAFSRPPVRGSLQKKAFDCESYLWGRPDATSPLLVEPHMNQVTVSLPTEIHQGPSRLTALDMH
jgi:hypothetical protein